MPTPSHRGRPIPLPVDELASLCEGLAVGDIGALFLLLLARWARPLPTADRELAKIIGMPLGRWLRSPVRALLPEVDRLYALAQAEAARR